jgi:hypothetical protein
MMTPAELERNDFLTIAVHEVAHALQLLTCRGIDILRNPQGASREHRVFSGKTSFLEEVTPAIAIAGELANHLHNRFIEDHARPDWPEGFKFQADDFIDVLQMEMDSENLSATDSIELRNLSLDELYPLAEDVAATLRDQWADLLRIVGILVAQLEEYPTSQVYGFTEWQWRGLA